VNGVANLSLAAESRVGNIAFVDLKTQQRRIREAVEARLKAVLDHGRYIAGPEIEELEELLAERTGAKAAVACANGTAALLIPLLAREICAGDAVFVPAFTYNATANAILLTGATPVFVDIDPATFNIDPADLERRINDVRERGALTPRAVIPVDLFGSPADYRAISTITSREELYMLADGAQSFGGRLDDRLVGDLAPATATSFFPGKSLGAYGDAGAILTQDADDRECWESIRWQGTDEARKNSIRIGFNGRMDSFQAAVLLEKLDIFDDELAARRRIADIYNNRLSHIGAPQRHGDGAVSGYGYYALRIPNRDYVVKSLKEAGVPTAVYYATPLHKMPAFEAYAPVGGLPETEKVSGDILSLPMHPYLTPDQVDYICGAVEAAVK
jgi:UDP-2-acetamido-2-deoxy-ribo-hexuluronate aminotransferase